MLRLTALAILMLSAAPLAAQPRRGGVDCIDAGLVAIDGFGRELTAPHEGGRLSISATLQNRTTRPAAFTLTFNPPNVQTPSVQQWNSLDSQGSKTLFVGTLPRGTMISDDELRGHMQLRCVP
ncbi:MAG: hypothetical protein JWR00_2856 [Rubritepida sp.]|nr:hypothetical protein [Rubritepida sp.]MDB5413453.1 hypothetical protein [Rubritepida sp.]